MEKAKLILLHITWVLIACVLAIEVSSNASEINNENQVIYQEELNDDEEEFIGEEISEEEPTEEEPDEEDPDNSELEEKDEDESIEDEIERKEGYHLTRQEKIICEEKASEISADGNTVHKVFGFFIEGMGEQDDEVPVQYSVWQNDDKLLEETCYLYEGQEMTIEVDFTAIGNFQLDFALIGWNEEEEEEQVSLDSFTGRNEKEIYVLQARFPKTSYYYRETLEEDICAKLSIDSSKEYEYQYKVELPENHVVENGIQEWQAGNQTELILKGLGVGQTSAFLSAKCGTFVEVLSCTLPICIEQSGMEQDVSFLWKDADGKVQYQGKSIEELEKKLLQTNSWINGTMDLTIDEKSKRWFSTLCMKEGAIERPDAIHFGDEMDVTTMQYWLMREDTFADTSLADGGIQDITFGIDHTAPKLNYLIYSQNDFLPTRENTKAYYSEALQMKGTFTDEKSGIDFIEYSTGEEWKKLSTEHEVGTSKLDFELILQEGEYPYVAFRCWDVAGNVCDACNVTNASGETMSFVVDMQEPVMHIQASTNGESYAGAWTNQDIALQGKLAKPQRSGIYKIFYQYKSIGEKLDLKEKDWKELEDDFCYQEDHNGYFFVKCVSKAGVEASIETIQNNKQRIRLQKTLPELEKIKEEHVTEKRKNEWFNKETGVPFLFFQYPKYDTGVISKEYGAPITVHTDWTVKFEDEKILTDKRQVKIDQDEVEDIEKLSMDFSFDAVTRYARDGIYTLHYWIEDEAGNQSEIEELQYLIDTHEPELNEIVVADKPLTIKELLQGGTVYEGFYQSAVSGHFSCELGISGEDIYELFLVHPEKSRVDCSGHSFSLEPGMRGTLELRVEDLAGNTSVFETQGIVVDSQAPIGDEMSLLHIPEGANEHGFYKEDFVEEIVCKDMPEQSFSSIKTINFMIGNAQQGVITQDVLLSEGGLTLTEQELMKRGSFQEKKVISAKSVESNEVYAEVEAIDYCGNKFVSRHELKVDVTKPVVELLFSDEGVENESFYDTDQFLEIQITEKNFSDQVQVTIIKNGEAYFYTGLEWTHEGDKHTAKINFCEDGVYQVKVVAKDLADNESEEAETKQFIIDKTFPVLAVTELDQAFQENFYNHTHILEVCVAEEHFCEQGFVYEVTGGEYQKTAWVKKEQGYVCQFAFFRDGIYTCDMECIDQAGNKTSVEQASFVIDMTAPKITILGVENDSANKGTISPQIVVEESNYDIQDIKIEIINGLGEGKEIHPSCKYDQIYSYDLSEVDQYEDQIYYLTATVQDLAGNQNNATCRFSLNRYGSTYDLTEAKKCTESKYLTTAQLPELVIKEFNFDPLEESKIFISRDGNIKQSTKDDTSTQEVIYSCTQSGDAQKGYRYTYHISKENFKEEGFYRLFFYSKDTAGNEVNSNMLEKNAQISFVIDNTCPSILLDGVETDAIYRAEEKDARILVTDNFGIANAMIYLIDKEKNVIKTWDYLDEAKEMGKPVDIVIPSSDSALSLVYEVTDYAGNTYTNREQKEDQIHDFLITTNMLRAFLHKVKPITFVAVVSMIFIILLTCIAVHCRKQKGNCSKA